MSTDLPVFDHRPGTGPSLVFVHYWGGSARTWTAVADRLPGRDLIRLDLRGWGRSRALRGPYTVQQYAADVLAVVREAEVDDFVLVGHSMGGKVAQLSAAERPEGLRGLVLVAPGPAVPPAQITAAYRERLSHAYDDVESVAFARDHVLTATPLPDELKTQVLADSRSGSAAATRQWPLHGIGEDISDRARAIAVPSLVVAGELDIVEPPAVQREHMLPYLAHGELVVVPGSGHLVPLEAPDELASRIEEFVDGLGRRAA